MEYQRPRIALGLLMAVALAPMAMGQHGPRGPQGPAGAGPKGRAFQEVLDRLPAPVKLMFARFGKQRYSGQRVVEFRLDGERYKNIENLIVDGLRSRIEFAAGSSWYGQVIVDNRNRRTHFFPDRNEIFVGVSPRDESIMRLRQFLQSSANGRLKVTTDNGPDIVGRKTTLLQVADPNGNPVQRVWIENTTGIQLKREIFDRAGSKIGAFEFTRLNLDPKISDEDFVINRRGAKVVDSQDRLRAAAREAGITPIALTQDSGALLQNSRAVKIGDRNVLTQTYILEGRRLTLFQFKGNIDMKRLARQEKGLIKTYRWEQGGYSLVLVGEMMPDRLAQLAKFAK
ncbi:MAG: hypothetical protein JST40_07605 [Armatimonadetes bacterium]|nr:hypothetical protein [Armatimonadota bacterium]